MEVIYSAWKVEQINDYLFIDTYKSNKVKIGVKIMTVNDSERCVRWYQSPNEACNIMPSDAVML